MKKLLFLVLLVSLFSFSVNLPAAQAAEMSVSQLVELLISIGVINSDKAEAARSAVSNINKTSISRIATPYFQVFSPNGGESWAIDLDLAYVINWGSSGDFPVSVSLVPPKGTICNLTPSPVISKNGSNTLKVLLRTAQCYDPKTGAATKLTDGTYKVRVSYTDATGKVIQDDSNGTFKITPPVVPSVKVTYPNGGEKLLRNNTYEIKYTLKDMTDGKMTYMNLLDAKGNRFNSSHKYGKNGVYEFKINSTLTEGAYKVELRMVVDNKTEVVDTSDDFFWVAPAF